MNKDPARAGSFRVFCPLRGDREAVSVIARVMHGTTSGGNPQAPRDVLSVYSGGHDAELIALEADLHKGELRLRVEAHHNDTDTWKYLTIACAGVYRLNVAETQTDPAFEDYTFPKTGLIDRIDILNDGAKDGDCHFVVRGTYGWKIDCACDAIDVVEGEEVP